MRLAALLLLALPQDPEARVRELLERLADDSVETRERAAGELVALGRAAEPHLRALLGSGDPEVRGRAEAILRDIAVHETLRRSYRPAPPVTLSVRGARVADVLAELAARTGERLSFSPADFADPLPAFETRGATLWSALEDLCRAAPPLDYGFEDDEIVLRREPRAPCPFVANGPFLLRLESIVLSREYEFTGAPRDTMSLSLLTAWERGLVPARLEVRITELLDDRGGRLLPSERVAAYPSAAPPQGRFRREQFRYPIPGGLQAVRRLDVVRGYALFGFPRAFREGVLDPSARESVAQIGDTAVSVRRWSGGRPECTFEVSVTGPWDARGTPAERLVPGGIEVIDDRGAAHPAARVTRSVSYAGARVTLHESARAVLPEGRSPVRLCVRLVEEMYERRVPFEFRDVPLE
jgi:hypothetical protein